jgi:hypothetical protein
LVVDLMVHVVSCDLTLLPLLLANLVVDLLPWVMLTGVAVLLIVVTQFVVWWMLFGCPSCLMHLLVPSELVPAPLSPCCTAAGLSDFQCCH